MVKRVEVSVKENGEEIRNVALNVPDHLEAPSEEEMREGVRDSYENSSEVECPECDRSFDSEKGMKVHKSQAH